MSTNWLPLNAFRSALENSVAAVSFARNVLSLNRFTDDPSSSSPRPFSAISLSLIVESSQSFSVRPMPGTPRLREIVFRSIRIRREFMMLAPTTESLNVFRAITASSENMSCSP